MTDARERVAAWRPSTRVAAVVALVAVVLVPVALLVIHAVTEQQQDDFRSRSLAETRSILAAIPDAIDREDAERLGRALRRPQELEVVLVDEGGGVNSSSPVIGLADVPGEVRTGAASPGGARTRVAGEPFLVTGGPADAGGRADAGGTAVFLFFSERPLDQGRARTTLIVTGLGAAVLTAAASGGWLHTHRRARALSARRAAERAYTAHLAHELRTPVGALVTAASLVDGPELHQAPDRLRQPVEVMQDQARRLRKVVEDQLELSRLEAGQVEIRSEPVDVAQVVREVLTTRAGSEAEVELDLGTAVAWADRQSLSRLLINLINNATRHARDRVRVVVRDDGRSVTVAIVDDGPGLRPDLADVLVGSSASAARGGRGRDAPGLGLLIARAHASLLDARVAVEAGEGEGTTIRIRLRAATGSGPGGPG